MYDEKIALLGGKKKLNNNKLTNLRPVKGNDDRNLLPVVVRKSVVRSYDIVILLKGTKEIFHFSSRTRGTSLTSLQLDLTTT
jgi:hypothetical protein